MVGFWIFLIVLIICITIVACIFIKAADTREFWSKIYRLDVIVDKLEKIAEQMKVGGIE